MSEPLDRLVRLVATLRESCPWDREQTFDTLQTYLLEETHEVLDALASAEPAALRGELGDLLFQIFFLSRIAAERGWFGIDDVASSIEAKMIARHPHVFGAERAEDAEAVKANWEKRKRRDAAGGNPLAGIPKGLPALSAAFRMSERAADLGFDWEREADLLEKVAEEVDEAREAARGGEDRATEEELGDLLFALANWARRRRIDPERALRLANSKFRRRFGAVAERARADGKDVSECGAGELDGYWNAVKAQERASDPPDGPGAPRER
jgi:MazG family protein